MTNAGLLRPLQKMTMYPIVDAEMYTLLFDIDGTLIHAQGAGSHAMKVAMISLFGNGDFPNVPVHGRTDRGIVDDIFQYSGLNFVDHGRPFSERYWEHLPDSLHQSRGSVLPGVRELLETLAQQPEFALGLLTGNARRAAEIKLAHFQLNQYFSFGGFGDTHACRNEVARLAVEDAEKYLGEDFDSRKVWVIGDTVNDITCARSIGAKAIVVNTGGGTPEELAAADPDAHFDTLETEAFLRLF